VHIDADITVVFSNWFTKSYTYIFNRHVPLVRPGIVFESLVNSSQEFQKKSFDVYPQHLKIEDLNEAR